MTLFFFFKNSFQFIHTKFWIENEESDIDIVSDIDIFWDALDVEESDKVIESVRELENVIWDDVESDIDIESDADNIIDIYEDVKSDIVIESLIKLVNCWLDDDVSNIDIESEMLYE